MKKFEFLPHTADLKIVAYGQNEPETLKNAVFALNQFLKPKKFLREKVSLEIDLEAKNKTYLWIDFLSEVLTQIYVHKAIFTEIDFTEFSDSKIKAILKGRKFASLEKDIKAITYHQAEIKKNHLYQFTFICDI